MKTLTQLLPLAIGAALVAGLTWFLLDRDVALGRWLLAALILGHGLAHLAFVVPTPEPARATGSGMAWPFDLGRAWPVTRIGLDARVVRGTGTALTAVTIVTSLLAALAAPARRVLLADPAQRLRHRPGAALARIPVRLESGRVALAGRGPRERRAMATGG